VKILVVLLTIVALTLAGCSWPSALHAPYFFAALFCSIGWASNLKWLKKSRFLLILRMISLYLIVHLLTIPVYHNHFVYEKMNQHQNFTK
jgi:hypothetical protein